LEGIIARSAHIRVGRQHDQTSGFAFTIQEVDVPRLPVSLTVHVCRAFSCACGFARAFDRPAAAAAASATGPAAASFLEAADTHAAIARTPETVMWLKPLSKPDEEDVWAL